MTLTQFNIKLNPATLEALTLLAQSTQRSRAGVVRWLVLREASRLVRPTGQAQADPQEVDDVTAAA
jgi:hypothetical protein